MGAIFSAFVGYAIKGLPAIIHIPLALLAGALGGAIWGFIPGWLKAKTGGHEVINTIMMNYIAFRLSDWLLSGPMKRPNSLQPGQPDHRAERHAAARSSPTRSASTWAFSSPWACRLVYWFLFKTTWGFDLRTVGANPYAGRYAGMKVSKQHHAGDDPFRRAGGLAGANEVLGVNHNLAMAFSSGYGFDSIALALLGNNHAAGGGAGLAAVWHAAQRRNAHAGCLSHPNRYHFRSAGHHPGLHRCAGHHPHHLPPAHGRRKPERSMFKAGEGNKHGDTNLSPPVSNDFSHAPARHGDLFPAVRTRDLDFLRPAHQPVTPSPPLACRPGWRKPRLPPLKLPSQGHAVCILPLFVPWSGAYQLARGFRRATNWMLALVVALLDLWLPGLGRRGQVAQPGRAAGHRPAQFGADHPGRAFRDPLRASRGGQYRHRRHDAHRGNGQHVIVASTSHLLWLGLSWRLFLARLDGAAARLAFDQDIRSTRSSPVR